MNDLGVPKGGQMVSRTGYWSLGTAPQTTNVYVESKTYTSPVHLQQHCFVYSIVYWVWVYAVPPGESSQLFSGYSICTDTLETELRLFSELLPGNEGTLKTQQSNRAQKKIITNIWYFDDVWILIVEEVLRQQTLVKSVQILLG